MTEGEQPLKPKGIPEDPDHILRCQYKYSNQKDDYYILADFEINDIGVSYANWSKYRYIDEHINSEDSEPIISTTTLEKDFQNMIESEGYEREGGPEFVICK